MVSVDYRLAPRHRHPSAMQDVLTALAWATDHEAGAPVAVGDDSAGGTLAVPLTAPLCVKSLAAERCRYPQTLS
ncbi:alpha/beta hydrolase fold domain-containing protein [Micromonospora sp. MW-13]|uniref:alpha/beta hydrolase fold domain-containing protein n=1 Tax=Micromonospora sp. MW-13 TaxID=2094022 RepID=UPI00352C3AF2